MATILLVDDTRADLLLMEQILQEHGHTILMAEHVPEALELLSLQDVDLIISDNQMPQVTGLEFLEILRRDRYGIPFILGTAYATVEDAVASMKGGALDYFTKPIDAGRLLQSVHQALEVTTLREKNVQLQGEVAAFRNEKRLVAESPEMRRVLRTINAVALTRATVLIEGESGTGKEVLVRALHDMSDRRHGAFVAVNCAAIPEMLVESTLFGHEKGAFTGATVRALGAFERADKGTLLLDEITEMRLDLQSKLLRVLQEQEFHRVGGSSLIRVDVRVVATTNRDLRQAVREGAFREDLYYRLAVVPIRVPPLRDRKSDIPRLVQKFCGFASERNGRTVTGVSRQSLDLLMAYDWPGNVRELEHIIERSVILAEGPILEESDFDESWFDSAAGGAWRSGRRVPQSGVVTGGNDEGRPPVIILNSYDIEEARGVLIAGALEHTAGNRKKAAEILGITDRTLRNRLNQPDAANE